jgi:hypothetical protein
MGTRAPGSREPYLAETDTSSRLGRLPAVTASTTAKIH